MAAELVRSHFGEDADVYLDMIRNAVRSTEDHVPSAGLLAPLLEDYGQYRDPSRPGRHIAVLPLAASLVLVLTIVATGIIFAAQPWASYPSWEGLDGPVIADASGTAHGTAGGAGGSGQTAGPTTAAPSTSPNASTLPAPAATTATPKGSHGADGNNRATPTLGPMFVAWVVNPPVPPQFRLRTLPSSVCRINATGRGQSKTFLTGANGQGTYNWTQPKWTSGTYQISATCWLGNRSASTPTVTVVIP